MILRTLIVDDEPLARAGISDFVAQTDFLREIGQAKNGLEALEIIGRGGVDLLLLDIQMPGLSGTELIRSLHRPPAVIFTTAHPSFAVEGFELDAVDYLLKPIAFPRFLRAVLKARSQLLPAPDNFPALPAALPLPGPAPADIFIREEGRVERILTAEIRYAEAMQNYCRIHTGSGHYLPLLPLTQLLESLPAADFIQIHRSYLVNIHRVDAIVGNQVRIGDTLLPISRNKREEVREKLVGGRLL